MRAYIKLKFFGIAVSILNNFDAIQKETQKQFVGVFASRVGFRIDRRYSMEFFVRWG